MSDFKQMDPDEILKLLEGHEDLLTPLVAKEDTFFRHSACPTCGSVSHDSFVNPARPFSSGSPLPNKLLRCRECSSEFDPYTNLITKASIVE